METRGPAGARCVPAARGPGAPGWPCRRHYLWLALFITGVAIYGSLVPLRYRPLSVHEALERFREIPYLSIGVGSRADWVANILLLIPVSYCWLAVLLVDRRFSAWTMVAVPLVALLSAVLSVALEFTQLWFPPRTVSQNDILAETIGGAIGVGLWLLIGQTLTDWIRSYTVAARPKRQIDWLLQAYFVGLLVYSVLPLDLTISATELVHKYREGKISLVPFSHMGSGFVLFYGLFRDVAIFVPIGMLAATWLTPAARPVRSITSSVVLGGLVVLGIEVAQLLVYSRFTAAGDVISGTLGVFLGACAMRWWWGPGQQYTAAPGSNASARRAWLWLGLAGVYCLFLAAVFCAPFDVLDDLEEIKARYRGFFYVPFARLYTGSEFNAVSEVLKKLLFYAPLGVLLTLGVAQLSVPRSIRRILLALMLMVATGVSVSIEMAQVFFPPHVPDITDVLLCTAGAAAGMFVTVRVVSARREDSGR